MSEIRQHGNEAKKNLTDQISTTQNICIFNFYLFFTITIDFIHYNR